MSFKIPRSILYLAIGMNASLFLFGVAIEEYQLSILATMNILLCSFPMLVNDKEEE